jgi:hypothetical protein
MRNMCLAPLVTASRLLLYPRSSWDFLSDPGTWLKAPWKQMLLLKLMGVRAPAPLLVVLLLLLLGRVLPVVLRSAESESTVM